MADNIKDLLSDLESASKSKDVKNRIDELTEKSKLAKAALDKLDKDSDEYKKYSAKLDELNKKIGISYSKLGKETDDFTDKLNAAFGELVTGLDANSRSIGTFTEATRNLVGVYSNFGENLAFWRDYDRRIREVGVSYGISANRLEDYRSTNKKLEQDFIKLGGTAEELQEAVGGLYDTTNQTNQLSTEFVNTIGGMTLAMGMSGREAAQYVGQFNNLNVSFQTTGKILTDLRNSAEKSALNTQKVLNEFTKNFEKLNTYSFRNGVQGMMDMVRQSNLLKVNMDSVLQLSDKLIDPEQTIEFASNMQLLGGSFAQLGDFNQLMYDAAVAPEDLAKNIARATASMGTFNRETGNLDLSFVDRQQLKAAAKELGMTEAELNKMASTAKKSQEIRYQLNFKPLTDEQYDVLGAMSQFDTTRGEYTIKVKDEKTGELITKSVAELSPEDIDKIAKTKETEDLKSLATQKFDAVEMTVQNMKVAMYESPDAFAAGAGFSDKLKTSLNEFENTLLGTLSDVKKNVFQPIEKFSADIISTQLSGAFDNATQAIIQSKAELIDWVKEIKKGESYKALSTELQKVIDDILVKYGGAEPKKTGELGGILTTNKFSEGSILNGLSHKEGGIPFTIGGKSGFEAEGGEVLLTKGVSEDPALLSIVSKINEMAGGKKLFEDGGVIDRKSSLDQDISSFTKKMYSSLTQPKKIDLNVGDLTNSFLKMNDLFLNLNENLVDGLKSDKDLLNGIMDLTKSVTISSESFKGEKGKVISSTSEPKIGKDLIYEKPEKTEKRSVIDFTVETVKKYIEEKKKEQTNTFNYNNLEKPTNVTNIENKKELTNYKNINEPVIFSAVENIKKELINSYDYSKIEKPSNVSNIENIKKELINSYNYSKIEKPTDISNISTTQKDLKNYYDYGKLEKPTNISAVENIKNILTNLNNYNNLEKPTNISNVKNEDLKNYSNINQPTNVTNNIINNIVENVKKDLTNLFNYSNLEKLTNISNNRKEELTNYKNINEPTNINNVNNIKKELLSSYNYNNLDKPTNLNNITINNATIKNFEVGEGKSNVGIVKSIPNIGNVEKSSNISDNLFINKTKNISEIINQKPFFDKLLENQSKNEIKKLEVTEKEFNKIVSSSKKIDESLKENFLTNKITKNEENFINVKTNKENISDVENKKNEENFSNLKTNRENINNTSLRKNEENFSNIKSTVETKNNILNFNKETRSDIFNKKVNDLSQMVINAPKNIERLQGGLIEKRQSNFLNTVSVNGMVNVGGKIDFGTIKVDIGGTTKEIATSDAIKKEIFNEVEKMVNSKNKNLYVTQMTQKNTGIDTGKKQIIPGITDVGDGGVSSWFM